MTTREWHPHTGPQEFVLTRQEFEILYGGARGGGKTDAGLVWLTDPVNEPRARALVLRRNSEDLTDWIDRAAQMYIPMGARKVGNPAYFVFPSGYVIRTGHLKDDDAYTKYQGHEYHRILIEELTQIPDEARYLKVISSARSTVPGLKAKVFLTANPGGVGHSWVKKRFKTGSENSNMTSFKDRVSGKSRIYVPARVDDNHTLMQNDPSYVNFLEGLRETDEQLYKAWRNGDWDVFVGQFFDTWDNALCVIPGEEIPVIGRAGSGYDYGYGNPACHLRGIQDQDDRVWISHEFYASGKEADEQGEEIKSGLGGLDAGTTYCDPSIFSTRAATKGGAKFVSDALQQSGIVVKQANNNRVSGWAIVRKKLQHGPACSYHRNLGLATCPMLHVSEACQNLIRTIPEQVYAPSNKEDLDTTAEDHAEDTLRYLLVHMPNRINSAQTNDLKAMQQAALAGTL